MQLYDLFNLILTSKHLTSATIYALLGIQKSKRKLSPDRLERAALELVLTLGKRKRINLWATSCNFSNNTVISILMDYAMLGIAGNWEIRLGKLQKLIGSVLTKATLRIMKGKTPGKYLWILLVWILLWEKEDSGKFGKSLRRQQIKSMLWRICKKLRLFPNVP